MKKANVRLSLHLNVSIMTAMIVFFHGLSFALPSADGSIAEEGEIRIYLNPSWLYNSLAGDFDGTSYFESEKELILIPKLKNGGGYGLGIGIEKQTSSKYTIGLELIYGQSSHGSTFLGIEGKRCALNMLLFHWKMGYWIKPVKIYWYAGILGRNAIKIPDGVFDIYDPSKTDSATYRNDSIVFLHGGLGLATRIFRFLEIDAGMDLRLYHFKKVAVFSNKEYDIQALKSLTPNFHVGLSYSFLVSKK